MKTNLLILIIVLFSNILKSQTATPPSLGNGTESNPYEIETLDNLYWVTQSDSVWDRYFIQTNDIDALNTNTWDTAKGFKPIGNEQIRYKGSYNGKGHIISNLYINRPNENYIGLFGYVSGGMIDSLGLDSVNIMGGSYVGGLMGFVNTCNLENSFVTGNIKGNTQVGGVVGCSIGSIINSYCKVNVEGNVEVGGFVGFTGDYILNCYCVGSVTVDSTQYVGGFSGWAYSASVYNSFWDIDVSEQTSSWVGEGKTTQQMYNLCTYLDAGWDFIDETNNGSDDIWGLNNNENGGYPFLSWQGFNHTETCIPAEVKGYENNDEIVVFPNPATNYIVINKIDDLNENIQILDIMSKILVNTNNYKNNNIIDISNLEKGIYFIKIGKFVKKFIKN